VVLCPFCSFHRVEFREDRTVRYFRALRDEIRRVSDLGFRFCELYIGGGTPTVMPDELLATVQLVRELHPMQRMSTETNPDDIVGDRLQPLRDAGINRLSVGVQSFDDSLLRKMQRYDKYGSSEQIRERLASVRGVFETLNIDMIFNLPQQTERSLQNDLRILTDELAVDQVSFYPLMTANSARKAMHQQMGVVDYRREKALYTMIARHMLGAGYVRSSAWCFSRQESMIDEYIAQQDEYLGLGSGAFSFLQGSIYASTFSINHYLRLVAGGQTGLVRRRSLARIDQMRYHLLMRLFGGSLDLDAADRRFDGDFTKALRLELTGLRLIRAVRRDRHCLRLTERGYYLWVMMMREFFTGVNNLRDEMRHHIHIENNMLEV
jgi:coproporphyrinogen III oxidase-like Fe-S oxidoreductase